MCAEPSTPTDTINWMCNWSQVAATVATMKARARAHRNRKTNKSGGWETERAKRKRKRSRHKDRKKWNGISYLRRGYVVVCVCVFVLLLHDIKCSPYIAPARLLDYFRAWSQRDKMRQHSTPLVLWQKKNRNFCFADTMCGVKNALARRDVSLRVANAIFAILKTCKCDSARTALHKVDFHSFHLRCVKTSFTVYTVADDNNAIWMEPMRDVTARATQNAQAK